ncbi:MAG: pyrimidine reductase family protein [Homoserinimonas sp.]|nr:pyrimidine reductase family protein [Homoserinimonas sp.]
MPEPTISCLVGGADAATDDELIALYSVADRRVPWLRANFVSSLDGAGTHAGVSAGLGTAADKRVFALLRRLADVIIVGAGTVRAEGYRGMRLDGASVNWRKAHGLPSEPVFAVVSSNLNFDPAVFDGYPVRPLVLTGAAAPGERLAALSGVADIIVCGEDRVDIQALRQALVLRGLTQLHSEGGPSLFGALIADGAVDELCLTLSPLLEGGDAPRITRGAAEMQRAMELRHVLASDDGTLLLRYTARLG